jgi:uncharacterized protein YlxW (UPF0749 family)
LEQTESTSPWHFGFSHCCWYLQRQVAVLTAQVHKQEELLDAKTTQCVDLTTELRNAEKWRARVSTEFEECQSSLTAALKEAAALRQSVWLRVCVGVCSVDWLEAWKGS